MAPKNRLVMPIEIATAIKPFDQEAFHAMDRRVMRVVFDVHNEFGRLFDENLYKCEIAARCGAIGILPVEREIQIRVSHQGFFQGLFYGPAVLRRLHVGERNQPSGWWRLIGGSRSIICCWQDCSMVVL